MKILKTRSKKDKLTIVLQILFAFFCVTDLKNYWYLFIIFSITIFFNIRQYVKNKKNEEQVEEFLNKGLDLKSSDVSKKLSKKENESLRKHQYEKFLEQVEEDFSEDEFEEVEDEEE